MLSWDYAELKLCSSRLKLVHGGKFANFKGPNPENLSQTYCKLIANIPQVCRKVASKSALLRAQRAKNGHLVPQVT